MNLESLHILFNVPQIDDIVYVFITGLYHIVPVMYGVEANLHIQKVLNYLYAEAQVAKNVSLSDIMITIFHKTCHFNHM